MTIHIYNNFRLILSGFCYQKSLWCLLILGVTVFTSSTLNAQSSPIEMSSGIKPAEDMNRPFIVNGSDSQNQMQQSAEFGGPAMGSIVIDQEVYNKRLASQKQAIGLRLFSASELQQAYNESQVLHKGLAQFPEVSNFKVFRSRLFADRGQHPNAQQCIAYWQNYYAQDTYTNSSTIKDYTRALLDMLGNENYENLRFCLAYIGLEMSDALLYKAYFGKKEKFALALFNCKDIGVKRLPAYFLALDIEHGMCNSLDPSNFTKQ